MLIAERRGEYDTSRTKDALIVKDADTDTRVAIFLDERKSLISIAVDLPNKSGSLCYSVPFDVLVDVLRARLGAYAVEMATLRANGFSVPSEGGGAC